MISILAVLVLAAIYAPVFADMARIWLTNEYAAHGMFVPALSAILLWEDRGGLRAVFSRREPAGMLVILIGLGILALGKWTGSVLVQGLSAVVAIAGVVLWNFGAPCLRRAAFPVGFLVFMAPLPSLVVDAVTLDLQFLAAGFAGGALGILGVPFYRDGLLIQLPGITLTVAEVCNGLRFLTALVVVAVAFAQLTQPNIPRKLVLVASAIPLAILANGVRVATISVGVYYVGPQVASDLAHTWIGEIIWGLTFVLLVALASRLRRGAGSRGQPALDRGQGSSQTLAARAPWPNRPSGKRGNWTRTVLTRARGSAGAEQARVDLRKHGQEAACEPSIVQADLSQD